MAVRLDPIPDADPRAEAAEAEVKQRRRESEAHYRALVEHAPVGIISVDGEGRFRHVNRTFQRMLGYSADELRGRPFTELSPPDELSKNRVLFEELVSGLRESFTLEKRYLRKDGGTLWARITVAAVRDDDGRFLYTTTLAEDITAAREVQDRLRVQAALLDAVGQAVIATDLDGRITYWGRQAEVVFGRPAGQVLGTSLLALAVDRGVGERIIADLRQGHGWSGELELRRADGRAFPAYATGTPVRDPEGTVVGTVGVVRDQTERKALERQLQQAQRMEAVGRLAGGVAHDFNNLLVVISGTTQLLLRDVAPDEPLHDDLREIEGASQRAARLTQQLLAFSRRQVLQPQRVDLNGRVLEAERMLRRLIGEDVRLTCRLDPEVGCVFVDPGQLDQVMLNLVVNARDAMPLGGHLRIETGNLSSPNGVGWVRLSVRDDGHGMDDETRSKIFDPFFTTKPAGQGTGLGLATVYGIVDQSGGRISVESEPGRGSVFHVDLPRHEGGPAEAPGAAVLPEVAGRATILLVEDEPVVRKVTRRILERGGYQVLDAADGAEALRLHAAHRDAIDLMITDAIMPGMSGPELAARVRAWQPTLRILFVSGYTDDRLERTGLAAGAFLQKPYRPDVLLRRVAGLLAPR